MRKIKVGEIAAVVKELCMSANYDLGEDVTQALRKGLQQETSTAGVAVLNCLLENAEIARKEMVPMCQDTGASVFFVELGQEIQIEGGLLSEAINEGVRQGYKEGYLRTSMVVDPLFKRKNTGDNSPAIIHLETVRGDRLKIAMLAKGGGCENMSRFKMLNPSDGVAGVKQFILETAKLAGPNACPPIIVGVGIGGTFEKAALLAKKSLLRPVGSSNPDPEFNALEEELLEEINKSGIGPQGYGGRTTSLSVHIETFPCHIASLPVAVNIECHAHRHKEVTL